MKADFKIGDIVFLITDPEQKERIVTAICFRNNYIQYELSHCTCTYWANVLEISKDKDILKTLTNTE